MQGNNCTGTRGGTSPRECEDRIHGLRQRMGKSKVQMAPRPSSPLAVISSTCHGFETHSQKSQYDFPFSKTGPKPLLVSLNNVGTRRCIFCVQVSNFLHCLDKRREVTCRMLYTAPHNRSTTAPAFQPTVLNATPSLSLGYFPILDRRHRVGLIRVLQIEK